MLDRATEKRPSSEFGSADEVETFRLPIFLLCFFPQEKVFPRFLFLFKKQTHIVFPQKKSDRITLRETQPDCLKRKGKFVSQLLILFHARRRKKDDL
jgi:hypothetical protein